MMRSAAANGKPPSDSHAARGEPLAARFAALWRAVRGASDTTPLTLGVTACRRGHGVSTVAANLALTAAHSGWTRVALVEANTAAPCLARAFDLSPAPGVAEVLRGDADLSCCVQETAVEGLCLLAAGRAAEPPALSDGAVKELLHSLEHEFAVVVCDLPVATQSAAQTWAGRLDGVLLVIEPGQVPAEMARTAKHLLEQSGARLLGVVLTKCDRVSLAEPRSLNGLQDDKI